MKVIFNNFFYDQDLSPFLYLFKLVFNEPIEMGTLEDSDILIESIFGNNTFLYKKKWLHSFCFIGESDRRIPIFRQNIYLNDYSCVLKGEINNKNIVNFPLFVFYNYCYKFVYEYKNKNKPLTTIPPKDVCVIISNPDSEGRTFFLDQLEERVKIDYAGSYKNNVKQIQAPHCSKEFIDFVSQYKIIISMENSKNKDYITEKILHGFSANTVPVYWGSDNILTYFNKERFINVESFNRSDILEAIEKIVFLINNPSKYLETVNQPIYKDDHVPLTLTQISYQIQNLLQIKNTQHKRFITFGNELYYNSVRRICKEAQNLKCFNEIYGFSDNYLKKQDFWVKHGNFIESNKRGYGYWLWKPYLIKTELDKLKENDILVYCDSGCQINENGKRRLHEYVDMLNTTEHGIISFQLEFLEPLYTKNKVFETLEFKEDVLQCMATVILLKKNANSTSIINEWYAQCENYELINDDHGKEDVRFIDHRHDQSILSVIVNKRGSLKLKDETYFSNWNDGMYYPFLAKRLR